MSDPRPTEPSPEQRAANLAEQSTWPAPDAATRPDTHRKAEG